jgi:UDP-N-acetylmuramoyl-tripeptide--D-alanyl-D-alanine ligase
MNAAPLMTLAQAHALIHATVPEARLVGEGSTGLVRLHSDTRTLQAGDCFVALTGERFDAHDFLPQARAAGASAVLVARDENAAGLPALVVPEVLPALQALAAAWRAHHHLPVAAVVGSNGKTTVTQMVAAILQAGLGTRALGTQGNLNNHIGVPLMLLRLRQDDATWHRAAVFELGMNHPGEVALLARLVQPSVALINNAQREHQEFMHSVQAVAEENGSVIDALPASGTVVVPQVDAFSPLWRARAGKRQVWSFGLTDDAPEADLRAHAQWTGQAWALDLHTPCGHVQTTLAIAGRHNALNACAAAATALALGVPGVGLAAVAQGLARFQAVAGRSVFKPVVLGGQAVALVDDSYNANPDSVAAAIALLRGLPGPRWLILGDMGEVGSQGPAFHEEAGAQAHAAGIEHLWCAGPLALHTAAGYGTRARRFDTARDMAQVLPEGPRVASVLIKGSRFIQMEQVVQALLAVSVSSAVVSPGGADAA